MTQEGKQANQGGGFQGDSAELLDRAAAGDPEALDELFQKYLPALRAFLRLRMSPALRAKESCSDLANPPAARFWNTWTCSTIEGRQDSVSGCSPRLGTSWPRSRKLAKKYRHYGRDKRDIGREQAAHASTAAGRDEELAQVYQTLSTPSRPLMRRGQVERLEAAFEELPEHFREVITLSRVVGLSHREVAQSMGRSEGATRVLLHRALGELADVLERS